MRPALMLALALLCSLALHAQNSSTDAAPAAQTVGNPATPGCGLVSEKFDVKTVETPQPDPAPEPGKALVYFVQDDRFFIAHPRPTVKWGVDGKWVGATRTRTYFYVFVDPGEHHLCSAWQGGAAIAQDSQLAVAHFTAEAGRTYYFRAQNLFWREMAEAAITLDPVDSDEGALLASRSGYSVATPKN
jgi:Protein of unknown function (DUF2846)